MGFAVTFGRARNGGARTLYHVLVEYSEEQPARAALETALRMTLAAMHGDPFDVAGEIEKLRDLADDYKLGPSTGAIVAEARRPRDPDHPAYSDKVAGSARLWAASEAH